MPQYAVGVDLGGTNIKAALVERDNGIQWQTRIRTEASTGPERILERVGQAIDQVRRSHDVVGVGIGSPGTIDLDRRRVTEPPNLPGWGTIDLAAELEQRCGLVVSVDNDANVAGLGSAFYGAGRPFDSFIMVTLGTGVGGAIIYRKEIFRGAHGGAGELGHLSVDYEGPFARSGIAGALEAYLGQQFLTHHARYRLLTRESALHDLTGPDLEGLNPRLLHEAAKQGDEAAIDVLAWAGHKLGVGLGSVVNVLDIRKIVVGGGLSAAGDFLLEPARAALRRSTMPAWVDSVEVVREDLGNDAALLGAARLAFEVHDLSADNAAP
jgi:glucokinase